MVLREHEELLPNPVVQLQVATLASILENFPMPFFMVDPDLVVTHVNERLERLTGFSGKEGGGPDDLRPVLNTEQCGTCDCVLKKVMEDEKPISGLRRVVRDRQGREIPVTWPRPSSPTRRAGSSAASRPSGTSPPSSRPKEKIDLLTEHTQEGLLMADEHQRVLYVNSRMAEILQHPKEELLGQHLGELLTAQHLHMALELANRVEQGQERETRFCSLLNQPHTEEGEPRVFETCMAVSRLGNKPITCLYLRDLTDRVRIERELQKTNAFLHNIIRSSVDGIVVVDPKGVPIISTRGPSVFWVIRPRRSSAIPTTSVVSILPRWRRR